MLVASVKGCLAGGNFFIKIQYHLIARRIVMKPSPLRRNIKKSEQVQQRPAAALAKSKNRNFVVSFARTNKGGGRKS
jgi:hypothetical protein